MNMYLAWGLIKILGVNMGVESPKDLHIHVLDDSVCTPWRSLLEGATILWEHVTCSSVVPEPKVTLI